MSSKNASTAFVDILLRAGIIIFIFGFLFGITLSVDTGAQGWNRFLQIVLLIVFIVISYIIVMLDRIPSQIFGFSIIMLISIIKLAGLFFSGQFGQEIYTYILMLTISVYFVTKSSRNKKRKMTVF